MADRHSKLLALADKRKQLEEEGDSDSEPTHQKESRPKKITKYASSDDEESEEEEEESEEDNYSEEEEEVKPKKKKSAPKPKPSTSSRPLRKRSSKKNSDDEGSDDGKGVSEDELETLDTSVIIPGGRRTRGKRIDYKQFGEDPDDEE